MTCLPDIPVSGQGVPVQNTFEDNFLHHGLCYRSMNNFRNIITELLPVIKGSANVSHTYLNLFVFSPK